MKRSKLLKAPPETLVSRAAKLMAEKNVGALIVVEGGHLVGICTERDIVYRIVALGHDARTIAVSEVMTASPLTVHPDAPFGYALLVMHENSFRHLPVVENDKLIGIVSARSALDPDLEEFVVEEERRMRYGRYR
ncbi:MAG: CBS domain-containing protein [Betaproteobacteria bacterium]